MHNNVINSDGQKRRFAQAKGKSAADMSAMLMKSVAWQTDMSKFRFLRCDTKANVARLLYQREGTDEKGPTVEFAVLMIHWENNAWRIGWIANSPGPKMFMGKERTVDEILENPRFALTHKSVI